MVEPKGVVELRLFDDRCDQEREGVHGMASESDCGEEKVKCRQPDCPEAFMSLRIEGHQRRDQEQRMGQNQIVLEFGCHGWYVGCCDDTGLPKQDQKGKDGWYSPDLGLVPGGWIELGQKERSTNGHTTKETEQNKPPCWSPLFDRG